MIRTATVAALGIAGLVLVGLSAARMPDVPRDEAAAGHAMPEAHAGHDHSGLVSLPPGPSAPTLDFGIAPDPVAGWNLRVMTSNFRFAPEHAGGPDRPGEGHAHLYANGEKIARLYGEWFHIDSLPPGTVELTVTLNANDHSGLAVGNAPLSVSRTIETE
ncbi:MAG TPA: hypothetical protein PKA33_16395 [Amaricoccus sp.]|uniref:hypothetical protein n=1 Tax=Amaricoccus sp. TaxID=1872485 RepID=UPI002C05408F|nr:hypothetical protein [Amaricoccus sp.]HMQ93113.1 hypothetical protein [Amaricoccus sp.]HMR53900.1 hypothetical protein [Amaricoccus sp.]HMR60291.1 hypothetical protein [Amaricoccus sp.]HMU00925.1 hypothetical protein [Amaricoccus sp.]